MKTIIKLINKLFRKPHQITSDEIISDNERNYFIWSIDNRHNPEVLPEDLIDISEVMK
jgi:hypothetical protein